MSEKKTNKIKSASDSVVAKYKKASIPSALRANVWNHYCGINNGVALCFCCNHEPITRTNHQDGHVEAEAKGGETTLENLRPICQNCNVSMGTKNMEEFMQMNKFIKGPNWNGYKTKTDDPQLALITTEMEKLKLDIGESSSSSSLNKNDKFYEKINDTQLSLFCKNLHLDNDNTRKDMIIKLTNKGFNYDNYKAEIKQTLRTYGSAFTLYNSGERLNILCDIIKDYNINIGKKKLKDKYHHSDEKLENSLIDVICNDKKFNNIDFTNYIKEQHSCIIF